MDHPHASGSAAEHTSKLRFYRPGSVPPSPVPALLRCQQLLQLSRIARDELKDFVHSSVHRLCETVSVALSPCVRADEHLDCVLLDLIRYPIAIDQWRPKATNIRVLGTMAGDTVVARAQREIGATLIGLVSKNIWHRQAGGRRCDPETHEMPVDAAAVAARDEQLPVLVKSGCESSESLCARRGPVAHCCGKCRRRGAA